MSEKNVILHEIILSEADTESVADSARTHFAIFINLHVPLKRKLLWRWARRVRVEFQNSLLFEIMTKLMKMRGGRQTSRVRMSKFCGAPALVISGFQLQGFNSSEDVHRKRLDGQTLSEGVVNTARPPECEFSNLHSSLAFGLLE